MITWEDYENCSNRKQWPGYSPTSNGCTSPVGNNPAGCENTSFLNACNPHDICYGTCDNPKGSCDGTFLGNLAAVCAGVPAGECHDDCIDWAAWYVYFVEDWGEGWYRAAQLSACGCCD